MALRSLMKQEEFSKCVGLTDQILQQLPGDEDATRVKISCLIALDKMEEALRYCEDKEVFAFERAYCLYRMNKLQEVLDMCSSIEPQTENVLNLKAQTYYRLQQYDQAIESYNFITSSREHSEMDTDLLSNIYAAHASAGRGQEALDNYPVTDDIVGDSFELLYNTVCALLSGGHILKASSSLEKTETLCREVLSEDGVSEDDIQRELVNVKLQKLFVGILSNKNDPSFRQNAIDECLDLLRQNSDKSRRNYEVMAVAANNLAVLRGDKDLPDSLRRLRNTITAEAEEKLSLKQLMEIRYNRCILLLHMRKIDDAVRALNELDQIYGTSTSQSVILRASIAIALGSYEKCDEILMAEMERLQCLDGFEEDFGKISIIYFQTLVARKQYGEALACLNKISFLHNSPGGVSASYYLKALRNQQENPDLSIQKCLNKASLEYLLTVAENIDQCSDAAYNAACGTQTLLHIARILEHYNHYSASAKVLQILLRCGTDDLSGDDRLVVTALLVSAMSHDNPEEAMRYADSLPHVNYEIEIDATDLENKDIPRLKKNESSNPGTSIQADDRERALEARRKKKMIKRRASRKAAYLKKLEEDGKYDPARPSQPDPERWIAAKQRSYNKRARKSKGKFVGGQGSGDGAQKDMIKLDARARSQAENPVSTGTVISHTSSKKKKGKGKKK